MLTDAFARKMKKFTQDGADQLLVIADFDRTLTPYYKQRSGPKAPLEQESSSHGLLMTSSVLQPQVLPVEMSPTLSAAEKLPFMEQWWNSAHALLVEYKLTKKQNQSFTPSNVHVVSNMMRFDAQGVIQGFDGNLIHSLNKTARESQLDKRRNVLLLGDSQGDARMAEGLNADEIIRVGFLNMLIEQITASAKSYKN
ncbi:HAD-like domain [Phytophthora cactorum]|nr:HAD-like domain [Phytophthora cactorum]